MNMSKSFALASYKGTFRDYQRHLLKKLEHRLDERKLNIVTPPGSGKVVLFFADNRTRRGTQADFDARMLDELKNLLGEPNVVLK